MKSNENTVVYNTESDAANLNHVNGFNPLKYVRNTENGAVLDLPYKKLWFRIKHPNGKLRLLIRNLSDKMAAVEARVYFDRNDSEPAANHIITGVIATDKASVTQAQNSAMEKALSDAGFGIQFLSSSPDTTVKKEDVKVETKPTVKKETPKATEVKPTTVKVEEPKVETKAEETKTTVKEETAQPVTDPLLSIVSNLEGGGVTVDKQTGEVIDDNSTVIEDTATIVNTEVADDQAEQSTASYDKTTPIDDIYNAISLDQAMNYVIEGGPYNGWVLSTLVERRPVKVLETIIEKYPVQDNILRAAIKKILDSKK